MKNAPADVLVSTTVTPPEFAENGIAFIYLFHWLNGTTDTYSSCEFCWERTQLFYSLTDISPICKTLYTVSISCCTGTKRRSVEWAICHGETKTGKCDFYVAFKQSQTCLFMVCSSNRLFQQAAEEGKNSYSYKLLKNIRVKPNQWAHNNVWIWVNSKWAPGCEPVTINTICLSE